MVDSWFLGTLDQNSQNSLFLMFYDNHSGKTGVFQHSWLEIKVSHLSTYLG